MSLYPWQVTQWQQYKTARDSQHLSHALLLVGNEGIGKHHFADIMAKSLLCEQIDTQNFACGQCKSCKVYRSHAHPDFKRIALVDGKKQIPVDAIRKLIAFLTLSRSYQGYRVVVIDHANKMNSNAANSLLKALEEPASHTVIILVVDQLSQMLPTIKSRCQTLHMLPPVQEQSLAWLQQQNIKSHPDILLNLADNKPILALQLDQQPEVIQQRNKLAATIVSVLNDSQSVTHVAKKLETIEINRLLNWQLKWVQQLIKQLALKADITQTKHPVLIEMHKLMQQTEAIWELYEQLLAFKAMTDYPLNRIIFIESMLLSWRAFALSPIK